LESELNPRTYISRRASRRQQHHLLHGQPVRSASRAGRRSIHPVGPAERNENALSWLLFKDLREQAKSFSAVDPIFQHARHIAVNQL
jgi:hypothetical protein